MIVGASIRVRVFVRLHKLNYNLHKARNIIFVCQIFYCMHVISNIHPCIILTHAISFSEFCLFAVIMLRIKIK